MPYGADWQCSNVWQSIQFDLDEKRRKHGWGFTDCSSDEFGRPIVITNLIRVTAALLQNARAGQLIVSESMKQRFHRDDDWVRFKAVGTIETDEPQDVL